MPPKECYLPELYESLYGSTKLDADDMEQVFEEYIELAKNI
jgi:hypothetical protein